MRNCLSGLGLGAVLAICACGDSTNKKLHDKFSFGTDDLEHVVISADGATLTIPKLKMKISGSVSVWERFPEVPESSHVFGYVYEFDFTPQQTFDPPATLVLPVGEYGWAMVRADSYGGPWTSLAYAFIGKTEATGTVDRFGVFAEMAGESDSADLAVTDSAIDMAPASNCGSDPWVAECKLTANGGHTCTAYTGTPDVDAKLNCLGAGGIWETVNTGCKQGATFGHCHRQFSSSCTMTIYYIDGLGPDAAQAQCEASGGNWILG